MPLHLLQKKSWNVYNPASIARVKADEAAAAAREEAEEQRQQEWDSQRRLAILRGLPEPAPLEPQRDSEFLEDGSRKKRGRDESGKDDRRERKRMMRRHGEDDTDRDIRVARQDAGNASKGSEEDDRRVIRYNRDKANEAPLVDHAGNIQLFAPPETSRIGKAKNDEAEAERKRKEQQFSDQYTMRFTNAAGFQNDIKDSPWYAAKTNKYSGTEELDDKLIAAVGDGDTIASSGKDAFGRNDEGRARRDGARAKTADPMAAMKNAQTKLKEVEKQRSQFNREREMEMREIAKMQRREERRYHRKEHSRRKSIDNAGELDRDSSRKLEGHRSERGHRRRHDDYDESRDRDRRRIDHDRDRPARRRGDDGSSRDAHRRNSNSKSYLS